MTKPIKLVISDLDGTLLGDDHQLSQETIQTVQKLYHSGVDFWIATGRHHRDALVIRDTLGLPIPMITANGATISDQNGQIAYAYTLPIEVAQGILSTPITANIYANAYQGDLWLTEKPDKVFEDYYHPEGFRYTLCQFHEVWHKPLNKIFFTSLEADALIPLSEDIEARFGNQVDVTFSMPQCLEIMPKGVNKGAAITYLLSEYQINSEAVIAYGDGLNDLEMLQVVGSGHLMANANPKLLEALPHLKIVGHHKDHAVAKSIQTYFNLD